MYFRILITGFLIAALYTGCSSDRDSSETEQTEITAEVLPDFSSIRTENVFVYNCVDSLQFTAHVTEDSTWLFLSDTTMKVLPVQAGSGARYEGDAYLFWSKEQEAILQKPRGSFMVCQTIPEEKSWQAAKLRGVDFRALGQEPGWFLEIKDNEQIKYVGRYGQDTLITPVPEPETEQQGTVYRTGTASRELVIKISDEPCTDRMSGFEFPFKVSVAIDGQTVNGCGRNLR